MQEAPAADAGDAGDAGNMMQLAEEVEEEVRQVVRRHERRARRRALAAKRRAIRGSPRLRALDGQLRESVQQLNRQHAHTSRVWDRLQKQCWSLHPEMVSARKEYARVRNKVARQRRRMRVRLAELGIEDPS